MSTARAGKLLTILAVLAGVLPSGVAGHQTSSDQPAREVLLDPDHAEWSTLAPGRFVFRLETDVGPVRVEVFRAWAPHGADRLYNLLRLGFYDDTRVFRVREGVFAQFGLAGDPAVDAAWYTHALPDDPRARSNRRGTLSFAMLETPGTRTTQLFFNLRDNPDFDAQGFAPVGRVLTGLDVLDTFHAAHGEAAGGGMRGGRQGRILAEGNTHLDRDFPGLTRIHAAVLEPGAVMRYPNVGANRIRAEVHLLPAVSTGPLDPTWSPDGERIAFSMAGDLWVIDAAGGEAVALTHGPAYHFEPSWSPDGRWLAFSRDLDGNLDIGLVAAAGGEVRMLTTDPHVDIQPTWMPGGDAVLWASARDGSFDILRLPIDGSGATPERVVGGNGHQIQPAVSPDASRLAFVSPVAGRLGTGGIWTVPLGHELSVDEPEATLVHYEETSFRAKPRWSADGTALVFVSDESGSNDLAAVPADGGSKARLTEDPGGELDPAVNPSTGAIAFVSNRGGATRLYTLATGGGRRQGWQPVRIEAPRPLVDTAEVVVTVVDEAGAAVPARLHVLGADGRGHSPGGAFHRVISATDLPYFHTDGAARVRVPAGRVEVEARRGPEFVAAHRVLTVAPGEVAALTLEPTRLVDMGTAGWVSGDTHSHDLHQGRYGLSHDDYFRQLVAEDLQVTNALIHMDGTRVMGRWSDLTGEPHPLSTPTHVLQYAQEFRGAFGHVGLLGISEFVMPLIGGVAGTVFADEALNADWLDAAHAQGGIGGYMHPYSENGDPAGSEIALDVALGKGDFYDVANYPYDDLVNARMYWKFLGAGFRLTATGGSDNFADVWRDAPPGSARTYARVDGPPDVPRWLAAVRSGRTFATNGPLVLVEVAPTDAGGAPITALAAGPGEEIALGPDAAGGFVVTADVVSAAPLSRVDVVVNGAVVRSIDARGRGSAFRIQERVEVPGPAWIALMVVGPPARAVTDGYPFAHTTPVWVTRGGVSFADPDAATELAALVRAQWERVARRDRFSSAESRERYRDAAERAIAVYERIATTGRPAGAQ